MSILLIINKSVKIEYFMQKSLCIPRIDINIKKEYIINRINQFNIGTIKSIREVPLYNQSKYKRIILYFEWDINNKKTKEFDELLEKIGSVKLVYDMPFYWKLMKTNHDN
jgi:hypothetical protein